MITPSQRSADAPWSPDRGESGSDPFLTVEVDMFRDAEGTATVAVDDFTAPVEDVSVEKITLPPQDRDFGLDDILGDKCVKVVEPVFVSDEERLSTCENVIGYAFSDRRLLRNALTHSSSTHDKALDNERLEFFGDAVLDMVVREYLFHHFPAKQEGELTEAKSALVCHSSLANVAKRLDLQAFLHFGRGIAKKRAVPESLLSDAFEAVVAAIYLDGGYDAAKTFVLTVLGSAIPRALDRTNGNNYKSELQRLVQQRRRSPPAYRVLSISGPEHSRVFEVAVLVDGRELGRGSGSSKKAAEQEAARSAFEECAGVL